MLQIKKKYNLLINNNILTENNNQKIIINYYEKILKYYFAKSILYNFINKFINIKIKNSIYVYGGVGSGKTTLMRILFDCIPENKKRWISCSNLIKEIYDKIKKYDNLYIKNKKKIHNIFLLVKKDLIRETKIFFIDEFTITDIADGLILLRFIKFLFKNQRLCFITSNINPDNLYKNEFNYQSIMPIIKILKKNMEIININVDTDYRLKKNISKNIYYISCKKEKKFKIWQNIIKNIKKKRVIINLYQRQLIIDNSFEKIVIFNFYDICCQPLYINDYIKLTEYYHTFFIKNVPIFNDNLRNEMKRFIMLIDILYNKNIRLFISAESSLEKLYEKESKLKETFEFKRTISRIFEMQSDEYIKNWHSKTF